MQIFTLVLSSLAAITSLVLGSVAYKKNKKSATNLLFLIFCIDVFFWIIIGYFSIYPTFIENPLIFIRLTIFLAAGQTALLFLLMHTFPDKKLHIKKKYLLATIVFAVLTMLVTISPYAFTDAIVTDSVPEAIPGPGIAVFGLETVFFICGAIYLLLKKYKESEGILRQQLLIILIGVSVMFSLIILTIFLPVAIFQYNKFVPFHPLYTIFFQICATYAIIRYRFMDIRFFIKRSTAYVVSTVAVIGVYAALVLFAQQTLVTKLGWDGTITMVAAVVLIAVSVEPLRTWIIRVINDLLYSPREKKRVNIRKLAKHTDQEIKYLEERYSKQLEVNAEATEQIRRAAARVIGTYLGFLEGAEVRVFVPDSITKTFQLVYGKNKKITKIIPQDPLHLFLVYQPYILVTKEIPYRLQDDLYFEKARLAEIEHFLIKNDVEVVVPIGNLDTLKAIVFIGSKADHSLFTQEDVMALRAFQVQAQPALEGLVNYRFAIQAGPFMQ